MSKLAEKMAFHPDLVNACRDAVSELDLVTSDVTLADKLGELHAVHTQLGKAISKAKADLIARGIETLHGVRWQISVKGYTSRVVDQAKLGAVIDLDQFRTDKHAVRVTFKSLY